MSFRKVNHFARQGNHGKPLEVVGYSVFVDMFHYIHSKAFGISLATVVDTPFS